LGLELNKHLCAIEVHLGRIRADTENVLELLLVENALVVGQILDHNSVLYVLERDVFLRLVDVDRLGGKVVGIERAGDYHFNDEVLADRVIVVVDLIGQWLVVFATRSVSLPVPVDDNFTTADNLELFQARLQFIFETLNLFIM